MCLAAKDDNPDMLIKGLNSLEFFPAKNEDKWRIKIIKELLNARSKQIILNNFDNDEISNILDHVCIS